MVYGTEAGIFRKTLGVPTVVCGPGDIAQAHQPNEFILASQIDACEGFMRRMIGVVLPGLAPSAQLFFCRNAVQLLRPRPRRKPVRWLRIVMFVANMRGRSRRPSWLWSRQERLNPHAGPVVPMTEIGRAMAAIGERTASGRVIITIR